MKDKSYRTIKDLVFGFVHSTKGRVDYAALTKAVKKHFPNSKWQPTHWSWYRYQIRMGRFRDLFTEEEKLNLTAPQLTGRSARRPLRSPGRGQTADSEEKPNAVKRCGDAILNHVRFLIDEFAGDDEDRRFKLNRWVYARLMQDEIRQKHPIKQQLWDSGMRTCQWCGKDFDVLKDVEIHRKESNLCYSLSNCELLCRSCHRKGPQ